MRLHTSLSLSHYDPHKTIVYQYQQQNDKETSQNICTAARLTFERLEFIFVLYFPLRLPCVFCLSIHLPFSNLPADVTFLKLSSRQKAWETDQLVSGGTVQVLPLTEPTQTNADPGESREKGAQNGIRERDFSLFCCTFYFHFSKHFLSYFISLCAPLPPHLSLSFLSQYIKSNIPLYKKIFC
jgi:hypothetical protein